jgi:hypothetical protein
MCEINEDKQDMALFIKVFETDIYQVFVQVRQATPRQMISILFSHLELTNYSSQ